MFLPRLRLQASPVHPHLGEGEGLSLSRSTEPQPIRGCWLSQHRVCVCACVCWGTGGLSVALLQPHLEAGLVSLDLGGLLQGPRFLSRDRPPEGQGQAQDVFRVRTVKGQLKRL